MKHTTKLLVVIFTLTACTDSAAPISDVSMLDAKERQVAGINSWSGSIQAAAVVGDEVLMYSEFDTPASGWKMRVVSATGPNACAEGWTGAPMYPGRILLPDPNANSRAPNEQYFSRPLVAGTELTVVGIAGGFGNCLAAVALEPTRTIVTKVPHE